MTAMLKISMLLAQAPWAPSGDLGDRLDLYALLDMHGRLDGEAFFNTAIPWLATRNRPGQPMKTKQLLRLDEIWALQSLDGDDEPLSNLVGDIYRPGEIVTLHHPDGTDMLFRIVAVEPADQTAPELT